MNLFQRTKRKLIRASLSLRPLPHEKQAGLIIKKMAKAKQQTAWRNRVVGFIEKPANQFTANAYNFRRHPNNQRDAFRGVLSEIGFAGAVLENRTTGNLIDGHLRIEEALSVDENQLIPCVQVELSESEEKLLLATMDPMSAMATADKEVLDMLLREVQTGDAAVQKMLSELAEGEGLYFGDEPKVDAPEAEIDRAAELQEKWGTELGQLWEIGPHRLLVGDSTEKADVARLCAENRPFMMITDPPYGVDYNPTWRDEAGGQFGDGKTVMRGKVANDNRVDWTEAFRLFTGNVAYVWHASYFTVDVGINLRDAGFEIRSSIIWRKPHFIMSRGHYHWQHEPCWYAVRKGQSSRWGGDRTQSTIWDIKGLNPAGGNRDEEKTGHGTQKPVECMARPMRNHGQAGDVVYDPFLGSGSTLVAAQQEGRICYGMEIEPKYCAVILERMSKMGLEPKKLNG